MIFFSVYNLFAIWIVKIIQVFNDIIRTSEVDIFDANWAGVQIRELLVIEALKHDKTMQISAVFFHSRWLIFSRFGGVRCLCNFTSRSCCWFRCSRLNSLVEFSNIYKVRTTSGQITVDVVPFYWVERRILATRLGDEKPLDKFVVFRGRRRRRGVNSLAILRLEFESHGTTVVVIAVIDKGVVFRFE